MKKTSNDNQFSPFQKGNLAEYQYLIISNCERKRAYNFSLVLARLLKNEAFLVLGYLYFPAPGPGSDPQFVFTGPGPKFVFTGPGPQFVFTGPGPQFVFTGPGPQFVFNSPGPEYVFT